mmetsp:Transcript_4634/g.14783  ORF Transcript_4634/g.14783 Transcript_4634/m.14783 type:complete len:210 (-) Transcript_4634:1223-1852(-)
MATLVTASDNVNAECAARSARVASSFRTATAICRSDEPCAIIPMLTLALLSAFISVAEDPGDWTMPSPIIATMDMPSRTEHELKRVRENSSSKASSIARLAKAPCVAGTATVIDASDDAWVIMSAETPAVLSAARTLVPRPAAPSASSAPSSVTSDASSMDVMPFINGSLDAFSWTSGGGAPQSCDAVKDPDRPWMTVPGNAGLKMFRT